MYCTLKMCQKNSEEAKILLLTHYACEELDFYNNLYIEKQSMFSLPKKKKKTKKCLITLKLLM